MNPEFPVFIPTKGRWKTPYTIKALERMGVPYTAVVEPGEVDQYEQVVKSGEILITPHSDQGVTVTRNWIWDYAQEIGFPYYWTLDDNIRDFYRLHKNIKHRMDTGSCFAAIEDFAQRYDNLYISGMNYEMFVPRKRSHPPVIFNTRIYSNMLIKTDIPYRFQLFFNEDTDLCLNVLKDGHCTVQFNAFLADKIATMQIKGGNTDYYHKTRDRYQFCSELRDAHPDVVDIVWKWGRWQHKVNYRPYKGNKLVRKGRSIPEGPNEFGMVMVKRSNEVKLTEVTG